MMFLSVRLKARIRTRQKINFNLAHFLTRMKIEKETEFIFVTSVYFVTFLKIIAQESARVTTCICACMCLIFSKRGKT